jgi:hypothetical protein
VEGEGRRGWRGGGEEEGGAYHGVETAAAAGELQQPGEGTADNLAIGKLIRECPSVRKSDA